MISKDYLDWSYLEQETRTSCEAHLDVNSQFKSWGSFSIALLIKCCGGRGGGGLALREALQVFQQWFHRYKQDLIVIPEATPKKNIKLHIK